MEDKKAAYDQEFREGILNYKGEHPDETFVSIRKKLGVHSTTVGKWYRDAEIRGEVVVRESGNYESDEACISAYNELGNTEILYYSLLERNE